MSRDQFLAFLRRCVARRHMTEAEAEAMRRRWDRGEIAADDLPLEATEIEGVSESDVERALDDLARFNV